MSNSVLSLFKRDFRKAMNLRTWLIWIGMSAVCLFFFFTSSGRHDLVEEGFVDFMSLFLPLIIFGAWAVLSVYYDLISSDREHNVLDCILSSGISKKQIFASKVLTSAIISFVLVCIYLIPITTVIVNLSGDFGYIISVLFKYFLPLWGYIMVFAALGIVISIISRSSKAALIWSLAAGLVFMPRFFMIIVEGIGNIFHWTQSTKDIVSMISPSVLMEALSDYSNTAKLSAALIGFSCCIITFLTISYLVFNKQDEFNYGE